MPPVLSRPARMSIDEKRLAREMHFDRKTPRVVIASVLGRSLSSVCRLLAQTMAPNPVGRPAALTEQKIDKLEDHLNKMVDQADCCYEITLAMLMRRARVQ